MWLVGVALSVLLVGVSWGLARQRPHHRPLAWFFTATLAADIANQALSLWVLRPARAALGTAPYAGASRLAFHLNEGGQIARPAALVACAALVFLEAPARRRVAAAAGVAWVVAILALAGAYPTVRGPLLGRCYLAAELAALAGVAGCGWAWWQRWLRPSPVEGALMLLGCVELGAAVQWSPFGLGWEPQQMTYLGGYATLVVLLVREALWVRKSASQSSS